MSEYEEPEGGGPAQSADKLQEVLDRALTRFDAVAVPQIEVRAQALEARRFRVVPGAMWEGPWGIQWENSPRPEVDKLTRGCEKIETDYRENRLTVDFKPANGAADQETADLLDDMFRADAHDYGASEAWDTAFLEARDGGFGAFRVSTEYADPYDPDDDAQRINPGIPIPDADQSVYFYGGVRMDHADAEAAFVLTRDLRAIAEKKWGEGISPWPQESWKYTWDWYTPDVVCTAEYYEVEETDDRRLIFENELTGEEQRFFKSEAEPKEVSDLLAQGWTKRERKVKRRRVHKYIMSGSAILKDCGYIAGENIPIVPMYGRRAIVDSLERFYGYVLKKMDAQRILNTRVARMVEIDSTSPFETPVFDPSQMTAELAEEWARANIDRLPFLRALALRNDDGTIAQAGPIYVNKPPEIPQVTAALLQFAVQMMSDDDDPAEQVKANVSAEAMDIATDRVDARSGIYLDNARISHVRLGEIYASMAGEVYWEPGRKVPTRTLDGEDGEATLSETVLTEGGEYKVKNDLTKGRFKVIADVQESTATKQAKTVRQSLEISAAFAQINKPDEAAAALYTAVMNMDGEGMRDYQEYCRNKALEIGLVKPTPEEQAAMQQAAQQQQEPSAADQALQAQAAELSSKAEVNKAKAVETLASAELKQAQAAAVGGPVSEPETPSGLTAANDEAVTQERFASAELKRAQAEEIRRAGGEKHVRLGHEMEMDRRDRDNAERARGGD